MSNTSATAASVGDTDRFVRMNSESIATQIKFLEREMHQLEASEEYEALADILERIDELERERDRLLLEEAPNVEDYTP